MKSVYIMTVPSGFVKVGIASDPVSRRADLQVGCPEPIQLVCPGDVERDDAREIERDIHRMLSPYRIRGEWFRAPLALVHRIYKIAWVRARYPAVIARWERRYAI